MDPRRNPYTPGAGTPPYELAGREAVLEQASIALDRVRGGRPEKSLIFVGLRGVGKTVLLRQIALDAEAYDCVVVSIEADEKRSLPSVIVGPLRSALSRLSRRERAKRLGKRALRALGSFVGAVKVKYDDIELSVNLEAEDGLADSGDLVSDLSDLLETVGNAAKADSSALVLAVDELQNIQESQLAALIMALHHCAQRQLPVIVFGAGLPQLVGKTGKAKSYAERLFVFTEIGSLDEEAARRALTSPAEEEGVSFTNDALTDILVQTEAYPYFIQEWGKHSWNCAQTSPITDKDVDIATEHAIIELDESFFRVRLDRLTPTERMYLRAMAHLGKGPHRSGSIAAVLGKEVQAVGPTRAQLINKGMVYAPSHGDTAFTVPLFDQFMKRAMPNFTDERRPPKKHKSTKKKRMER